MIKIRNLAAIRSAKEWTPDLAAKMYEALQDFNGAISNHIQQTNGNPTGEPQPPHPQMGVQVSARDGWMHVAINDQGPLYRGVRYYVQHADNPNFTDPQHTQASGTEIRNHTEFIGNQTRYVQIYKAYPWSGPTTPVVHGGSTPIAVTGGSTSAGPLYLPSQGTGTSTAGQIVTGPGNVPFRSGTGAPPTRTAKS